MQKYEVNILCDSGKSMVNILYVCRVKQWITEKSTHGYVEWNEAKPMSMFVEWTSKKKVLNVWVDKPCTKLYYGNVVSSSLIQLCNDN